MTRPATHISNPTPKLNDGTVSISQDSGPTPLTTTDAKTRRPLLMRCPSYHRTHSHTHSPVSNVTSHTTPKPSAPLLFRTSPQLQSYSTMMQEHQSTREVMSPDPLLAQDSSPYDERQDHATPTKSWKDAHISKALLIHLLTAP